MIIRGIDDKAPKDAFLLSYSYVWFNIKNKNAQYQGTDYIKFKASNDIGNKLSDRLYFRVNEGANNLRYTVKKKLEEKELIATPLKVYKFFDYFQIDSGNGLMYEESDIPSSF